MTGTAFFVQRRIGEELLACGWNASAIADCYKPGSAWTLRDPGRRIRIRMSADFAAPHAVIAGRGLPNSAGTASSWRVVVEFASASAVLAAALAAASVDGSHLGSAADHRAVVRRLMDSGMNPDRSRLRRSLTGTGTWRTRDNRAHATWTAPRRAVDGRWRIATPNLRLDAATTAPAVAITSIIGASAPWTRQEPTA